MKTTKKILRASPLHQSPAPCGISVIETGNDPNPHLCACFKCRFLSSITKCELEGGVWRCLSYRTMFRLTVQCRRFFITELLRVYSSDSFMISLAARRDPHPPTGCFGSNSTSGKPMILIGCMCECEYSFLLLCVSPVMAW